MRRLLLLLLCFLVPAAAQDGSDDQEPVKKGAGKKGAPAAAGKYNNPDLGVAFSGVYGWEVERAEGSGAWTKLVRYFDEDFDAEVILYVRANPYKTTADLKAALTEEFKQGGEVAAGKSVYKDVAIREADMKDGNELPGIEVEGTVSSLNEDGKVRERAFVVRTYFGVNRLYRVYCTVRKRRLKNVRDLFTRAASGLTVTASDEKVVRGLPFISSRGLYSCAVPEGFVPDLPPANRNYDMQFVGGKRGSIRIYVYAFPYDGSIEDQQEDLIDYYGDSMKVTQDASGGKKMLGGTGLTATINKDKRTTLVTAAVVGRRMYRIHTAGPDDQQAELAAIHQKFVDAFHSGQ